MGLDGPVKDSAGQNNAPDWNSIIPNDNYNGQIWPSISTNINEAILSVELIGDGNGPLNRFNLGQNQNYIEPGVKITTNIPTLYTGYSIYKPAGLPLEKILISLDNGNTFNQATNNQIKTIQAPQESDIYNGEINGISLISLKPRTISSKTLGKETQILYRFPVYTNDFTLTDKNAVTR